MSLLSKNKKRSVGRPQKSQDELRVHVGFKLSAREKRAALKKAEKAGMNFSEYVRSRIL
jgi:hypothetical protein